jgi:hypothetical protein
MKLYEEERIKKNGKSLSVLDLLSTKKRIQGKKQMKGEGSQNYESVKTKQWNLCYCYTFLIY